MINPNYFPEFSRLNGEYINRFRVFSFPGSSLTIEMLSRNSDEYKLEKR